MKEKIKTITAFALLGITIALSAVLTFLDRTADVYSDDNTKIKLLGEAHGEKVYYDIEFVEWKNCYDEGCRDLFVELPYYSAEFLNIWMKEDSNKIMDQFMEDIQGTQSGNKYYSEFFHEIKEYCPETVFHGTDVGHQNETTGARYLAYLEENGLKDSPKYEKTLRCMKQGDEYHENDIEHTGVSPYRETSMVENFIDEYDSVGGKIMGIYGSYHTDLGNPGLMAGRLKAHYGNIISSVKLSSLAFGTVYPYQFGFSVTGAVFLVMLFVPNIIWGIKGQPKGYADFAKNENKILLAFERIGEVAVTCALPIFRSTDPHIRLLPEGLYFEWKIILWAAAVVLMILYECYWVRYFRSERTMSDFYSSFAGFPVAGASLPVIAALLLGIYSFNFIVIGASVILGIGHIGIHLMHRNEAGKSVGR